MRRASAIVMSGALGVALVGIAAPAAHAAPVEGSFEVVEWETQASCRNHGAPSPVVTYTVPSAVTSWRNILFAVDDQSGHEQQGEHHDDGERHDLSVVAAACHGWSTPR